MTGLKITIAVDCKWCDARDEVTVDVDDWRRYLSGEKVQDVWPNKTMTEREVLFGKRIGLYECPECSEPF